jgi:hypothetical protein
MRVIRDILGLMILASLGVLGCESTRDQVRPPKPQEEFKAPPENDPRYSKPIEYPRETMEQDMLLKKAKDAANKMPGPMNSPRMGPGRTPGM